MSRFDEGGTLDDCARFVANVFWSVGNRAALLLAGVGRFCASSYRRTQDRRSGGTSNTKSCPVDPRRSMPLTTASRDAKAADASRLVMRESGKHKVSLDQVIQTMYQTGHDMQSRYNETSLGGLALSVIEC